MSKGYKGLAALGHAILKLYKRGPLAHCVYSVHCLSQEAYKANRLTMKHGIGHISSGHVW